ncbi:response regulator [Alicyclobacillus cycloheptanicus]|uniref:DNA-binding NarL/FixJ family response regulator n=1 Tax=Alicyclobacillus cycloheptanicus TaxID=1457 RepID=A0ABT9XM37_9BACL|nr:response regulator transcription factor [Alicyclobacillus cycloheptanicus]MDQ0191381.1 DNA-binding NarL/FixJ family response regulator [Alicyclobacillus cycloheptanicus]
MPTDDKTIRVLLVDDQRLIREGLRYLIDAEPDLCVCGEADNGEAAVEAALAAQPDVILMDIQMPNGDGLTATRRIVQALPNAKVLLLTTFDVADYVYDGIRAGAVGYLLKDVEADELMACIRAVYRGQALYRTAAAAAALARAILQKPRDAATSAAPEPPTPMPPAPISLAPESPTQAPVSQVGLDPLTDRELEVLQEMAWGLRNDQIAQKLHISEGTVKTHVHRILQKFGVEDRTQAVVLALRHGIVQ